MKKIKDAGVQAKVKGGNEKVVAFKEFADTFMAVGRGELSAPQWVGGNVYASEKAKSFWASHLGEGKEDGEKSSKAKSLSDLARLIDDNRDLLGVIARGHFDSVAEVAKAVGRAQPNVSRSLSKLERFGVVAMAAGFGRTKKPEIASRKLAFEMDVITGEVRLVSLGATSYSKKLGRNLQKEIQGTEGKQPSKKMRRTLQIAE